MNLKKKSAKKICQVVWQNRPGGHTNNFQVQLPARLVSSYISFQQSHSFLKH